MLRRVALVEHLKRTRGGAPGIEIERTGRAVVAEARARSPRTRRAARRAVRRRLRRRDLERGDAAVPATRPCVRRSTPTDVRRRRAVSTRKPRAAARTTARRSHAGRARSPPGTTSAPSATRTPGAATGSSAPPARPWRAGRNPVARRATPPLGPRRARRAGRRGRRPRLPGPYGATARTGVAALRTVRGGVGPGPPRSSKAAGSHPRAASRAVGVGAIRSDGHGRRIERQG